MPSAWPAVTTVIRRRSGNNRGMRQHGTNPVADNRSHATRKEVVVEDIQVPEGLHGRRYHKRYLQLVPWRG